MARRPTSGGSSRAGAEKSPFRRLRERRHLTLRDLAARSEIKHQHISVLERGKNWPHDRVIRRLAVALETKPEQLAAIFLATREWAEQRERAA